MEFRILLTQTIFLAATGGFFSCVAKSAAGAVKKRKVSARISWMIFFLSLAVASAAAMIVLQPSSEKLLQTAKAHRVFLSVVFAASIVIFYFWKILLPLFLCAYAAATVLTFKILTSECEPLFRPKIVTADQRQEIELKILELPPVVMVPAARKWQLKEIQPENSFSEKSIASRYRSFLLADQKSIKTMLPEDAFYPAQFSIRIESKNGANRLAVIKDL